MGLFIGASILTILELFDYAYEVRRLESVCLLTRLPVERINKAHASLLRRLRHILPQQKKKNNLCLPVRAALPDNKKKKQRKKKASVAQKR